MMQVAQVPASDGAGVYENADRFDPLRFYRLREAARSKGAVEEGAHNQFVSVTSNNLLFGYGRHACPGRFFATNEVKMILANLLLTYDMKMTEGNTVRYPNIEVGTDFFPDPDREIMMKKIQV